MSTDGPEWFAAKRYGYGASVPISWQGWAVMLAFFAVVGVDTYFFALRPLVLIAVLVPAIVALLVVTSRTTRGGWRWRWGEKD
ncbi:MAG TPA: hypothetical protein VIZ66_05645 [Sphingomicrobium sp.]